MKISRDWFNNYLKSKNQLGIGRKTKLEIEKVELNINKKKCSKLIFGNYIDKANIIVKQNILHECIQSPGDSRLPNFTSNLLSAVKKNYFFIHPLPSEYNDVLKKNGYPLQYFDTVLCDPVWNLGFHVRHKLIYQLRDNVAPNGHLIFNCLWFPKIKTMQLEDMYVGLNNMAWRNVSLIGIYKKIQEQF